jgi:carbon storage regulator
MLVLTRKCNEQVVLPELGVAFTILEVRGDRVRVGVSAPPDTKVYRHEAWAGPPAGGGARGRPGGRTRALPRSTSEPRPPTKRRCEIPPLAGRLPSAGSSVQRVEAHDGPARLREEVHSHGGASPPQGRRGRAGRA